MPRPDPTNLTSRREALRLFALGCGLALSSSSLASIASNFLSPTDFSRSKAITLPKEQQQLLTLITELIIPTTDTPGAIAAGVPEFLPCFVDRCLPPAEQALFAQALSTIEAKALTQYSKPFIVLNKSEQVSLLTSMEKAHDGFTQGDRQAFKLLKSITVFAYYTSEIGASKELAYLAIPGGYRGNFKFSEIGRAWSLN